MSLIELQDLILPWLDIPTLINLRQTCRALRDPIQRHYIRGFDDPILFVQSTDERERDGLRNGHLTMDSWNCVCGQKNTLTYQMEGLTPVLTDLSKNVCQSCRKNLRMKRLFVGQLKRKNTLPSILWSIRMLCPMVQIITIENRIDQGTHRNKGCCWITVIDWTADMLLAFHRRIFYDTVITESGEVSGFWVVPNHPTWIKYLGELADKKLEKRCRSLPRKPMVVEVANTQLACSSGPPFPPGNYKDAQQKT